MKTSPLMGILILSLLLSACSSDSSSSGSGSGSYTGSKSDISSAKKLVKEYQSSNVFFEKGYITYSLVQKNTQSAAVYASYATDYIALPERYYAMRNVGCILENGSTQFTEQDRQTQMDLIVGEQDARAIFVQVNEIGRCYMGQFSIRGGYSVNGVWKNTYERNRGFIGISSDACLGLNPENAYSRIPKEIFNSSKESKTNNSYSNTNYNYWNNRYSWSPDQDYYYEVFNNSWKVFNYSSKQGSSEADSFSRISNGQAVFVSRSIRTSSSSPECEKDVYWGFQIDLAVPPEIQILGRN